MRPAVSEPIPHAERTVFAAGFLNEGKVEYFSKSLFGELNINWDVFGRRARDNAQLALGMLKPVYVRGRKNVIEYALLKSENLDVAATVLAPGFLAIFKDTLGSEVILAIPNRNTVYVFPKLASTYLDYAPLVAEGYHESLHPVSLEVFELDATGLKAVGIFEEADKP